LGCGGGVECCCCPSGVVVGTLKVGCFLGLRPVPFLTEKCLYGPCGPRFFALRAGFRLSAGHFFWVPKKSNQKKPLWPRAFRLTRNPLGAFLLCFPPARVAGPRAKYGACQHCSLHSTSCLRHEAFKHPYANFALPHVNPQVDKMQSKPGTPTALYSRLLEAGGWPQKALLTRPEFCYGVPRPSLEENKGGKPQEGCE
jgi:hypothetical protein